MKLTILSASLLLNLSAYCLELPGSTRNVLFIAVDDLRPALGCYGDKTARTPNIDALAEHATTFRHAYCQQAVCSPSRLSLMTGLRPDTIKVWDLSTHFREAVPDAVTLPQHFKANGYLTRSIGKIFHGGGKPSKDKASWSEEPLYDQIRDPALRYALPKNLKGGGLKRASSESATVSDDNYVDGLVCESAVTALKKYRPGKKPFFLAVGFRKPHLPFCAPKKYWDLYEREMIPCPVTSTHPTAAPEIATRSWKELEGYSDIPENGNIPIAKVKELRHGYYACVSYIDSLVGRLLRTLRELKLMNNTVICLWGDHGFHLGEQGLWTKSNNYELSTQVPLIISVPDLNQGNSSSALVELVDLYPTLSESCNLPKPAKSQGTSLLPLLNDPDHPWKGAAFSQFPRHRTKNRHSGHGDVMGYTVRTKQHRYVEWRDWETGHVLERELYDHAKDSREMNNLASVKEHFENIEVLSKILKQGWKEHQRIHLRKKPLK